ncbi:MAG: T9SS type A sorting domain-containing protein [Saprospiraceae bacterium]|nr:T9SS type A sorting domain-containing protein [Saprospiraceae bacterium]
MIKKNIFLIMICSTSVLLKGQEDINALYEFGGYLQHNAYAITEYDSTIYVAGQMVTPDSTYERNIFMASFDLEGKLLDFDYYNDSLLQLYSNNLCRDILINEELLFVPASSSITSGVVLEFNKDLDGFANQINFRNPETPDINSSPLSIIEYPKMKFTITGISFTGQHGRSSLLGTKPFNGVDSITIRVYEAEGQAINPAKLLRIGEDLIIIGNGWEEDIENDTIYFGLVIQKFDSTFQKIDERFYKEYSHFGSIMDGVITDNNEIYLVVSEAEIEYQYEPFFDIRIYQRPNIVKIDSNLNMVWAKPIGSEEFKENPDFVFSIVKSHFNNQFIVAGYKPGTDIPRNEGIIAKLDANGDTMWYRNYTSPYPLNDRIYDIISTSDGYYMACGNRLGSLPDDPYTTNSQMWLFKFDDEGHIVVKDTTTLITSIDFPEVRIFPNPSTEILYIEQDRTHGLDFFLYNGSGTLLTSILDTRSFHTYVITLSEYPSGIYYLHLVDSKRGLQRVEKVIVH